jgi:hypothetical protein
VGLLVTYGVLYLLSAKALVLDPTAQFSRFGPLPSLALSPLSPYDLTDWLAPAFVLYLTDAIVLAPSLPAILTVLVLGALVGVNGAMAVEATARRATCASGGSPWWVAAILPSFLASFSCCAPTVLLLLGGGAAGAVLSVIPFVVPAVALLLLGSLAWSARRLGRTIALAAA